VSNTPETDTRPRAGWIKAVPYAVLLAYALGPLLLIPLVSGPWPVVVFIFAVAAIAGLVDGLFFRPTWSLPIIAAAGFWIAQLLYFNDGTRIYSFGVIAVCAVAAWGGSLLTSGAGSESSTSKAQV